MWPSRWCTPTAGISSAKASARAIPAPTSKAPASPGPWVSAMPSRSASVRPPSASTWRVSGNTRRIWFARRQFRHHPAVFVVHRDLRIQRMRQQAVRAVIQRNTGFIAGGFDAKHQHRGIKRGDWKKARRLVFILVFQFTGSFPGSQLQMPHVKVKENEPFDFALRRLQAFHRKSRPVDRTARPRVLREAHRRSASASSPPPSSARASACAASNSPPRCTDSAFTQNRVPPCRSRHALLTT